LTIGAAALKLGSTYTVFGGAAPVFGGAAPPVTGTLGSLVNVQVRDSPALTTTVTVPLEGSMLEAES
jgi:hypothetical protein